MLHVKTQTVIGRYRDRQVPVELQLSFGAPITSAEDIKRKGGKRKALVNISRKRKKLVVGQTLIQTLR